MITSTPTRDEERICSNCGQPLAPNEAHFFGSTTSTASKCVVVWDKMIEQATDATEPIATW